MRRGGNEKREEKGGRLRRSFPSTFGASPAYSAVGEESRRWLEEEEGGGGGGTEKLEASRNDKCLPLFSPLRAEEERGRKFPRLSPTYPALPASKSPQKSLCKECACFESAGERKIYNQA